MSRPKSSGRGKLHSGAFGDRGIVGVTMIEVRTAGVTVTVVTPETPPWVAVTVALPNSRACYQAVGVNRCNRLAGAEVQLAEPVRS